MTRERTDRDRVARVADVREVVETPHVDEQRGPRKAQPQEREQRMAACEDLRVVATAEQRDRMLDRLGNLVVERSRDHCCTSSSARQTRSGVAGMSMSVTPSSASASTMAFITAAGEAIAPVSPTPFTPIGFVGLGVTVRWSSQRGNSAAEGTR